MFRACLFKAPRSLSFNSPSSSFHSAIPVQAPRRPGHSAKKQNIQRTEVRKKQEADNKPSVVLGTRPQEEIEQWSNCDLAKCLVDSNNLNSFPPSSSSSTSSLEIPDLGATVTIPNDLNYGIGQVEKKILFEQLPVLSVQGPFLAQTSQFKAGFDSKIPQLSAEVLAQRQTEATKKETAKLDAFVKVLDLRNASAKGIAYENRRRIILAFSTPENPFDTGRAEVQAALLTYQIRNLWNHLTTFKRDVGNRLGLRKLIHQRAKILRYLKSKSQDRYEALLPRLALDSKSVEGELVV